MKARTLALLAGAGASMLIAGSADAAFTGLVAEFASTAQGQRVRVYATFSNALDRMVAVAGTPGTPMNIAAVGGTFYQDALGGTLPPSSALAAAIPSVGNDSYVTIGELFSDTVAADNAQTSPGFPAFGTGPLTGTNLSWFTVPTSPLAVPDGSGRVLLGQFTLIGSSSLQFDALIQWRDSANAQQQTPVSQKFVVPTPGVLALLGIAGVVGTPRRRRS